MNWPKNVTELHVHLGGSVPLYRLWEMALDKGIRGIGSGFEDFVSTLSITPKQVKDLDTYLEVYDRIEMIQSGPEAVRHSVVTALQGIYRTGGMKKLGPGGEGGDPEPLFSVSKIELRFNPLKRTGAVFLKGKHAGLYDVDRIIKSACDAVEEVELAFKGKLRAGLILCFGRDMTFEANQVLADKIAKWRSKTNKIVGIDLAGSESTNPLTNQAELERFASIYNLAGKGLGKTVHVGETKHINLQTFIDTINALSPERVAHPIVALRSYWDHNDPAGLKLLKERGIVCELCIKSNLLTCAVKNLQEYARIVETLDQFGIQYTFSTDAPALQLNTLAEEMLLLLEKSYISEKQLLNALTTAERASFIR